MKTNKRTKFADNNVYLLPIFRNTLKFLKERELQNTSLGLFEILVIWNYYQNVVESGNDFIKCVLISDKKDDSDAILNALIDNVRIYPDLIKISYFKKRLQYWEGILKRNYPKIYLSKLKSPISYETILSDPKQFKSKKSVFVYVTSDEASLVYNNHVAAINYQIRKVEMLEAHIKTVALNKPIEKIF